MMTEDERARATRATLDAQDDKINAWLTKPAAEQSAILDKVAATRRAHGVLAARRMMAALGLPTVPDELCDPPEVLEIRAAQDAAEAEELGLEEDEPAPVARFDH